MKGIEMGKAVEILLVEDNPGDARLAMEAMKEAKVHNNMNVARDGVEAVRFLTKEGEHSEAPTPDVIFLDLNLPRMGGREVLKFIKENEDLKSIPVVILTVSRDEEDILRSYQYHANCYVSKPIDFEAFIEVVKSIEHFWFSVVQLPRQ